VNFVGDTRVRQYWNVNLRAPTATNGLLEHWKAKITLGVTNATGGSEEDIEVPQGADPVPKYDANTTTDEGVWAIATGTAAENRSMHSGSGSYGADFPGPFSVFAYVRINGDDGNIFGHQSVAGYKSSGRSTGGFYEARCPATATTDLATKSGWHWVHFRFNQDATSFCENADGVSTPYDCGADEWGRVQIGADNWDGPWGDSDCAAIMIWQGIADAAPTSQEVLDITSRIVYDLDPNRHISNLLPDYFNLTPGYTSTPSLPPSLPTLFSITSVDADDTLYDGQLAVQIVCVGAGATKGLVLFDGAEQDPAGVVWADTLVTVAQFDAAGRTLGDYEIKLMKPV
jgi:hypothetical protein